MNFRRTFLLSLAFAAVFAAEAAALPRIAVARTASPPQIDGKHSSGEWEAGRLDRAFTPTPLEPAAGQESVLYALYDDDYLYLALECRGPVPAINPRITSIFQRPRFEIRLGSREEFMTLVLTVTGERRPGNDVWQVKGERRADGYFAEMRLRRSALPESGLSDRLLLGNIIRVTGGGSSLFPLSGDSYVAPESFGEILLGSPAEIVADRTAALAKRDGDGRFAARLRAAAGQPWPENLAELNRLEGEITAEQDRKLAAAFNGGTLRPATGGAAARLIPAAWRPQKVKGKDFWFLFVPRGDYLRPGDVTDIPLFRDSMIYLVLFDPLSEEKPLKPLEKILAGEIQKAQKIALDETDKPFILKTACRPNYTEKFYQVSQVSIDAFLEKYRDRLVVFGSEECIGIRGYAKTLKAAGIPVPKTKAEGYQSFLAFYRYDRQTLARSWPVFYPDLHPYRSSGSATYADHLFLSAGDAMGGHEISPEILNMPLQIAVSRGAGRQHGKPWRTYIATHDKKLKYPGQRQGAQSSYTVNAYHEYLFPREISSYTKHLVETNHNRAMAHGPLIGVPLEDRRRQVYYTYMAGSNIITEESGHRHMLARYNHRTIDAEDPLVVNLRDRKWHLSPMGEDLAFLYDNIVQKRDRGTAYTPVALVWDLHHGYMPKYMPNIWDAIPPVEGDRMMSALEHTIFPYSKKIYNDLAFRVSPFGDIFDVVTNDASAETLESYPALFFCGDVPIDRMLADKLISYVENGGTLIVNAKQVEPYGELFPAGFFGGQFGDGRFRADRSYSFLSGKVIAERGKFAYRAIRPAAGTAVLATTADERKDPLILSTARGKGKIILTMPEYLKIAWERRNMLNLFSDLMHAVAAELLPVRVEGDIQYLVNRNRHGWVVSLFNNYGVAPNRSWKNPMPPPDPAAAVPVAIEVKTPAAAAAEWLTGNELKLQDNRVELTVPAGGVRIVEFY